MSANISSLVFVISTPSASENTLKVCIERSAGKTAHCNERHPRAAADFRFGQDCIYFHAKESPQDVKMK